MKKKRSLRNKFTGKKRWVIVGGVVVLLVAGVAVHSAISDKNLSESKEDEYKIDFQKSIVTIKEDGNIILKGNLTKIDSDVEITGMVTIEKDATINGNTSVNGSMEAKKGFKTEKVDLKEGILDIETVKYKELSKK